MHFQSLPGSWDFILPVAFRAVAVKILQSFGNRPHGVHPSFATGVTLITLFIGGSRLNIDRRIQLGLMMTGFTAQSGRFVELF